jgi:hypothetical protein
MFVLFRIGLLINNKLLPFVLPRALDCLISNHSFYQSNSKLFLPFVLNTEIYGKFFVLQASIKYCLCLVFVYVICVLLILC